MLLAFLFWCAAAANLASDTDPRTASMEASLSMGAWVIVMALVLFVFLYKIMRRQ